MSGAQGEGGTILLGLGLALAGALVVWGTGQGTRGAALVGFAAAASMVLGFGSGVMAPVAFLVLGGGFLTRLGRDRKERARAAEPNHGRRGMGNVVAKLGLPAMLGLAAATGAERHLLGVALIAALAGALADTAATETGPLAGGPVLRLEGMRLKRAVHGEPGGVSLAGVVAAVAAAAATAVVGAWAGVPIRRGDAAVAATCGVVAMLAESAVAGTRIGKRIGHFGRNVFVTTLAAALAAITTLALTVISREAAL